MSSVFLEWVAFFFIVIDFCVHAVGTRENTAFHRNNTTVALRTKKVRCKPRARTLRHVFNRGCTWLAMP